MAKHWVFVGTEQGPLTGIGPDPLTEDEFAARVAVYEAQFEAGRGSVARSGLYELMDLAEPAPLAQSEFDDAPPATEEA